MLIDNCLHLYEVEINYLLLHEYFCVVAIANNLNKKSCCKIHIKN